MSSLIFIICDYKEIELNGNRIFCRLVNTDFLKKLYVRDFLNEFTDIFCELNFLHPFREGNGRIQRLFLTMHLKNLDKKIDFSEIDKGLFILPRLNPLVVMYLCLKIYLQIISVMYRFFYLHFH